MNIIDQIKENAKKYGKRIVLAEGEEDRTLKAASIIMEQGLAKIVLLGNPEVINKKAAEKDDFLEEGTILTEEFIKTLPEPQQDICNQLNRRTEFRVIRTTYGLFGRN